jgi:hypothetical protein
MSSAGHGPNIGHGYVKYVVIDKEGNELPPVVFPAMISRAGRSVAGAIARVDTVSAGGAQWWTGEDALLAPLAADHPGPGAVERHGFRTGTAP